jgi:protocatechuate 3,4-dioxygenase beta subunit
MIAAVAITVCLTAAGAQAQTGTLQGTVTDAVTFEPVEGAFVVVFGGHGGFVTGGHGGGHGPRHATTDADGHYTIDELPVGDYWVMCGFMGYVLAHAQASIAEGETTTLDFALEPLTFGVVEGQVTDAVTGLPIAGAHVMMFRSWGDGPGGDGERVWLHAITGDDGTYRIDNVPSGDYNLKATAYGYFPSEPVPVTIADGAPIEVNVELEPLAFGSLEGTITDSATGEPIEGAVVTIIPGEPNIEGMGGGYGGGWHRAMTDENGLYRFDELAAGLVSVRAVAHGYVPAMAEVEIVVDETSILDLALDPLAFGGLEGTVTDETTGEPIGHAFVRACPISGPEGNGMGCWNIDITDENGQYSFEHLGTGHYRIRAFAWGYRPGETEADVLEGETTVADIQLEPFVNGVSVQ